MFLFQSPSIFPLNPYFLGGGGGKIRWENLWDFLTFGGLVIRLGLKPTFDIQVVTYKNVATCIFFVH
jgi:hypothetical protein